MSLTHTRSAIAILVLLTATLVPIQAVSGQETPTCFGEEATIEAVAGVPTIGTDGDDVIVGTDEADIIEAGAGNDLICSQGGPDVVRGQAGDDRIDAGQGSDTVTGGPGADTIDGGTGHDDLAGNSGPDTIRGQNGRDTIRGGTGNDDLSGGAKADTIDGNGGRDTIDGGKAGDTLSGGARRDTIRGGSGHDVINGGSARDTLIGDSGHDTIRGGSGADTIDGGLGRDICVSGAGPGLDDNCLSGLRLTPIADLGDRAGLVIAAPGDDDRLFVVEQYHGIRVIENGELLDDPFLNIEERISVGNEQGVLGLAFHPNYAENGRFFVSYTARNRDNKIVEYRVSDDPNVADPDSNRQIIRIDQPHRWHNGGHITFGPDGHLYIGIGDGGPGDDPNRTGQDTTNLLSGISRIDVDAEPEGDARYVVPENNPFVGTDGADELWAYGLRNPWRFSFDAETEMLYIGDVGQYNHDEVNVAPMGEGGINYGWSVMEGEVCFRSSTCDRTGLHEPLIDIPHFTGDCSVIGGWVYRGEAMPEFEGHFFYSDFCSREINSFLLRNGNATERTNWSGAAASSGQVPVHEEPPGGAPAGSVTSLGLDNSGELYISTLGGVIYRIEPIR